MTLAQTVRAQPKTPKKVPAVPKAQPSKKPHKYLSLLQRLTDTGATHRGGHQESKKPKSKEDPTPGWGAGFPSDTAQQ